MTAERAEKILKWVLGLLVFWDLGLGLFAVFFAGTFESMAGTTSSPDAIWARGTGMYWLLASYFQLLGARAPRKNLSAVSISIVFRLSAIAIDTAEVGFLFPRPPWTLFHSMLVFFIVCNALIAATLLFCLKRMNLPWLDLSPDPPRP